MTASKRRGRRGPAPGSGKTGGAEVGKLGGRPPTTATLNNGDGIYISDIEPNGDYADLGRGIVEVRRVDTGARLIVIKRENGSEVRLLIIPRDEAESAGRA